jgi:hypothetical protein
LLRPATGLDQQDAPDGLHDGTWRDEPHYEGQRRELREQPMSSGSAKEFEEFARDCVRLAEQADTPELREKLLNLAREWMRAVMVDEDLALRTGK